MVDQSIVAIFETGAPPTLPPLQVVFPRPLPGQARDDYPVMPCHRADPSLADKVRESVSSGRPTKNKNDEEKKKKLESKQPRPYSNRWVD